VLPVVRSSLHNLQVVDRSISLLEVVGIENVRNFLISHDGIADPLERLLRLNHVGKNGPFEESVIVWNVLVKLDVSSTDSDHELVALELDDLLRGSNQIHISLHMNNRNCDILLLHQSLDFFL